VQGIDYETISQRLKIKKESVLGYMSEVRSGIKFSKNISLSKEAVLRLYKQYVKQARNTKTNSTAIQIGD